MKSKSELLERIKGFRIIFSKTETASCSRFKLNDNTVSFVRDNTGQIWSVDMDALYEIYRKERFISTVVIRKYFSGCKYSPSLAILITAGFIDKSGSRL
jgi:hypothetical protein